MLTAGWSDGQLTYAKAVRIDEEVFVYLAWKKRKRSVMSKLEPSSYRRTGVIVQMTRRASSHLCPRAE